MRALGLVSLLVASLALPGRAAPSTAREFTELPPGRYSIALAGLLTTVCARAIAAEWARLPEVESASVDFDKSTAYVTVRIDRTLQVASLHKNLRRAEKLANLNGRYSLRRITYRLGK